MPVALGGEQTPMIRNFGTVDGLRVARRQAHRTEAGSEGRLGLWQRYAAPFNVPLRKRLRI